jgi:hypothetical protein
VAGCPVEQNNAELHRLTSVQPNRPSVVSRTRVRAAEDAPLPWSGVVPDGMTAMVLDQAGPPVDTYEQLERIGAWEKIVA